MQGIAFDKGRVKPATNEQPASSHRFRREKYYLVEKNCVTVAFHRGHCTCPRFNMRAQVPGREKDIQTGSAKKLEYPRFSFAEMRGAGKFMAWFSLVS